MFCHLPPLICFLFNHHYDTLTFDISSMLYLCYQACIPKSQFLFLQIEGNCFIQVRISEHWASSFAHELPLGSSPIRHVDCHHLCRTHLQGYSPFSLMLLPSGGDTIITPTMMSPLVNWDTRTLGCIGHIMVINNA